MNWNKIRTRYPKSWKLLENRWDAAIVRLAIKGIPRTGYRFLYEFFDDLGIYLTTAYGYKGFYVIIGECDWQSDFYKTRTEAEIKAFLKSFEILEEKLNK